MSSLSKILPGWKELFEDYEINFDEIPKPYYPKKEDIFKVFELLDVKDIKLLFLGQDCYINPGQAHGLSFSVPDGISIPPSLKNIFKEIQSEFPDRNYKFVSGNLTKWVIEEKIFLLNSALTVKCGESGSHMEYWSEFTDDVLKYVVKNNGKCIFLLLGNFAREKKQFIPSGRYIEGVHPSPFSANKGFFGSSIFKKVELKTGKINWQN